MTHNIHRELVFEILKRYTSEDNSKTPTEIGNYIAKDYPDHTCDRKTINKALKYLRELYGLDSSGNWKHDQFCIHYDVVPRTSSAKYTNYWLEIKPNDDSFSDDELMVLIDAVQFSKHINYKHAESIIKKLIKLSDNSFSEKFECYKNIDKEYHTVKPDFFLKIGDINRAINQHKKVSFYIREYDTDKELHRIGEKPLIVSPYRIVTSEGNYFLLGKEDSSTKAKSFRIDRISDVIPLDEDYASCAEMGRIKSHPEEYITEHRYLKSGKVVNVTMSIDKTILGEVIDTFGTGITIDPAPASSNSLTVHVKSSEVDIVEWVIRFSKYAVVLEPKNVRNEIMTRSLHLAYYFIHDENEEYEKRINTAKETGNLTLINIDMNKFDSYKDMKEIKRVVLGCNWIKDFSFLIDYPNLEEVFIDYNTIQDTSVITRCKNLKEVGLYNTDVIDLEFLKGLNKLVQIELDEYYLENIEAIYSIPTLKELYVNKATAALIDEKRLKKTYTDKDFIYEIVDFGGKPGQPATKH